MPRQDALPVSLPPRGLCRVTAAQYVGVSPTTFDRMVADGQMPKPKRIGERKVWDLRQVDVAFEALPQDEQPCSWDRFLPG